MYDLTDEQIVEIYSSEWKTAIFNVQQCAPSVLNSLFPLFLRLFGLTLVQSLIYRSSKFVSFHFKLVLFIGRWFWLNQCFRNSHIIAFDSCILVDLFVVLSTGQEMDDFYSNRLLLYFHGCRRMAYGTERTRACEYFDRYRIHCGMVCFHLIVYWKYEYRQFQLDAVYFMQVRGSLMIMAMKLISLAFDDENCSITTRIAYIFNPSTILFGPFINFKMFKKIHIVPVILFFFKKHWINKMFRTIYFMHFLCPVYIVHYVWFVFYIRHVLLIWFLRVRQY